MINFYIIIINPIFQNKVQSSYLKTLVLLVLFLFTKQGFSQLSKTHYIPPLTSSEFGIANPETQYIYLSTPSPTSIGYTIKPVGQPTTSYITGVVSNTNPQEIFIGTGNGQLFVPSNQTSTIHNDKGYIIEAEDVIYTSVRMNAGNGAQAGALVSKGLSALGNIFRVGTFTNESGRTFNNQGIPSENLMSFLSVMATEDMTTINISDISNNTEVKNFTGSFPLNIVLNKGESYVVAMNSYSTTYPTNNKDGLIGALIESDKDIVVNCGSANGSFHNGNGRDYGIDQIVGLDKIGSEYIFVKGDGTNDWENILIVAHTDNTSISINGNAPVTTINAGDFYLIEGNEYSVNGNMYIETSEDVFVYQGVGATTAEANQGMFFVPPLSCETRGNLDNIANIEDIGTTTYTGGISIVTKVGATVTINNTPISNFSANGPNNVDGNPNYVTYKVTSLMGNISVESDEELYCAYFNFNGAATSGSFYSGFPTAPEINFDATFQALGICIPNITLEVANMGNFDSIEWYFDDGTGFVTTGISTLQYTPTVSGTYKLIGILTCSNLTLESLEVPVSICPDDIDNDGIIDNIDIDNDNDGILNCTESYGNQDIDLSTITVGSLPIGGYTYTGIASTMGNVATTPFVGDTDGTFMSDTPNKNGTVETSVTYDINFNNTLNLMLEYATSTSLGNGLMNDDEEFIIQVPNTKTITLLDPDDQLLVDTDFDGIYQTGVTQYSSFEIRFKLNGTSLALGAGTFGFSANSVDALTYIHKNNSDTNSNQATFKITATCLPLDSDNDGIIDQLDYDSDNDGIPDMIENGGQLVSLSSIDDDLNGLDDIYDISANPIDSDTDSVLDYLDLDSDNDGITDLIETGQLGTLSDTDLDGTVDFPNYGINGWSDTAETAPDSNLIGYTPNDEDNDGILSYIDLDSDGDSCSDVIEAGFSDGNADDLLGNNIVVVNNLGLVTNAPDGYTIPNSDYLISAPISITTQPIDLETCEGSDKSILLEALAADFYQWETSTNGITWSILTDGILYNNTNTDELTIISTPLTLDNNLYRVKLDRIGNSCGTYSEEIALTVNPLPIITSPVILVQCDDEDITTFGFSPFNLYEANSEISTNASNETFTYYLTQASAITGDTNSPDFITDPTTFTNNMINSDTVWANVESQFGCSSVSEIQLNVSSTTIPNTFQRVFNKCDDFLDVNGNDNANNDDHDGISSFDFSSVTAEILALIPAGQNPLPPRYFRNEVDALAETNEITDISNYRNIGYPSTQQIYIRVDSDIVNDCLGLGVHITLNVEALPIANPVTIDAQCDDDQDGLYPFDTSLIESTILNGQSLADVSISYIDGITGNTLTTLPNPYLTGNQVMNIIVTNNTTGDLAGPCSDETTLEFVVDILPIANPVYIPPVCDGEDGDDDSDGFNNFETSTIQSTILGGQTGMEIHYFNELGEELSNPLPNPFSTETQTITVQVANPVNNTCYAEIDLNFVVNPLPDFNIEASQIVCSSDPTFTIILDPIEANPLEDFGYEWVYLDDSTILSNSSTLSVSTSGTYRITLTKTDGTNCSRFKDVFVNASEIATITLDDITIVDFSNNNTITINDSNNNLGLGDYEYSLGNEFTFYQDEPYFSNVSRGSHTLYVRDKNGCGTVHLSITVLGYPKFFTPNNDGVNEYWHISGVETIPGTIVYIFDRYGKLIKTLSHTSQGWDGTFNGNLMAVNDYWFLAKVIENGNQFDIKGHFTLKR